MKYEILEHTADLKIKAYGKDLAELFINMALGLASQQVMPPKMVEDLKPNGDWESIKIESPDLNSLFIDWLNEILYYSDVNKKIYTEFEIEELSEAPPKIKARIRGIAVQQKNIEIKAATYHNLDIKKSRGHAKRRAGGYEAIVVFDI